LGDERVRPFMRFVTHTGDDASFFEQERLRNVMTVHYQPLPASNNGDFPC